jgi:predicted alpha/beta-hydrolase family hydrolase
VDSLPAPDEAKVPLDTADSVSALIYSAVAPRVGATLVLAHGAGADQKSAFMVGFSHAVAGRGVDVITFNFPYTERRRRVPDKQPVLEACYRSVINWVGTKTTQGRQPTFIGGKSMGGRIATHVASTDAERSIAGLLLLGYPLHPPGRPDQRRDSHLKNINRPMLIVQGTRDNYGTPIELAPVVANHSGPVRIHRVEGGDHSFKLRQTRTGAQAEVFEQVQRVTVEWIAGVIRSERGTFRPHH